MDRLNSNNIYSIEAQWKNLPNFINSSMNLLVMADGSASMTSTVMGATNLMIANSLALYTAERLKSAFKDLYITFSNNPKFVTLKGNLLNRLNIAQMNNEIENTNIEKAFNLILNYAIMNKVKKKRICLHIYL